MSKFEMGDRVRVLTTRSLFNSETQWGATGTIVTDTYRDHVGPDTWTVLLDGTGQKNFYRTEDLELETPEVTHAYALGQRVRVLADDDPDMLGEHGLAGKKGVVIQRSEDWEETENYLVTTDPTVTEWTEEVCSWVSASELEAVVIEEGTVEFDSVDHPAYYKHGGIESIDFIEAKGLGFHLGNVVKYVSRAGVKSQENHVEDLRKARWYLDREIERLTGSGV